MIFLYHINNTDVMLPSWLKQVETHRGARLFASDHPRAGSHHPPAPPAMFEMITLASGKKELSCETQSEGVTCNRGLTSDCKEEKMASGDKIWILNEPNIDR